MRILSSLNYLMRSVVCRRELPNPYTISRLMHKVTGEREFVRTSTNSFLQRRGMMHMPDGKSIHILLGLHVGDKNVSVCWEETNFAARTRMIYPLVPPLDKEGKDIFWIAKQLKKILDALEPYFVLVGHYPWSREEEEQGEADLIVGAAKVERFMEELNDTGMLSSGYSYTYYDARVVLSPLGVKKRIQQLNVEEDERFRGKSESKLIEEFSDTYAAQFMLIHSAHFHGTPYQLTDPGNLGCIVPKQDGAGLTFSVNNIYIGKAFCHTL